MPPRTVVGTQFQCMQVGGRIPFRPRGTTDSATLSQPYPAAVRTTVYGLVIGLAISLPGASGASGGSSGALDPSFGDHGRVVVSPSAGSRAYAAAVQPDGKLVLAGFVNDGNPPNGFINNDFLVIRLTKNGGLDLTFGGSGFARTRIDLGGYDSDIASAVALAPDGKVVLAGGVDTSTKSILALTRYTAAGALDPEFSGDGVETIDPHPARHELEHLNGVAVQPDGRIVAVGDAGGGFLVMRLLPSGALDESFGSHGVVETNVGDPGARDSAFAVSLLGDGKMVVAGMSDFDHPSYDPAPENVAVVRYLPNGQRDPAFGSDGIVVTPGPRAEAAFGIAPLPDGKLVVTGIDAVPGVVGRTSGTSNFHLVRYLPSGEPDPAFGSGGAVTTTFRGKSTAAYSVIRRPDGKLLVAGTASANPPAAWSADFALARYTSRGALDKTFSDDGRRTYDVSGGADYAYALALQKRAARSRADRLVLAGDSELRSGEDRVSAIGIDLGARPLSCRVPRVVGLTLRQARARILAAHCRVGVVRLVRSARPPGRVVSQRPRAGRDLPPGTRVDLAVSSRRR